MSWEDILKNGFTLWAKVDDTRNWMELTEEIGSRDDMFEVAKREAAKIGRTVVGSASEGKIVIIDEGIFESVTEPVIYYVIKPTGDSAPDPSYIPNTTESNTAEGVLRRFRGDFDISERY